MTRILFIGTPDLAAGALECLVSAGFEIIGVITQPDREVGRGKKILPSAVKICAQKHSLPLYQPETKNELTEVIRKLQPDITIVAAYGKIFPQEAIDIPKYGTLNIHASLLPKYRGGSCIPAAILNGDKQTGVTIIKLTKELDAGPILSTIKVPIEKTDTTKSLTEKITKAGSSEIVRIVPLWIDEKIKPIEQDNTRATFCPLIKKDEGLIDWLNQADKIEREIRAYNPWPGAFSKIDENIIKFYEVRISEQKIQPGKILIQDKRLFIGTASNALEVFELQIGGKQIIKAVDFANGYAKYNGRVLI